MSDLRLTALAASLPSTVPFVGPETQERRLGQPFVARLGANESAFGPSPKAIEAIAGAAADAWMYGDPENHDLRRALATHHGVPPDAVVVGEGIDGLLGYLVRLTVAAGDPVVTSLGAYPTFNYHVAGFGGDLHAVPYRGDHEDLDALARTSHAVGARLVYLANPDNPMGSWHNAERVSAFLDALPDETLLVLDEAYVDFAPPQAVLDLDVTDPRLIRMRTFSKAHGLAGLRVGYALCHPNLAQAFNKVRNHFGMTRVSQAAAMASLADSNHLARTIGQTAAARTRIGRIAARHGLLALPSATNFVAIDCGADGARARAILNGLVARGIFVRMPGVAPLDRCIRISCGPDVMLDRFAEALRETLAQVDPPEPVSRQAGAVTEP
ncbi:MAG: pyridoxal phosphate-dependent aminotransferase [Pseudomonadota bacterium]